MRLDAANRQLHLDGGDVLRARTSSLACGVAWRHLSIDGFERLAGKGISYGAARSQASNAHSLDVHIIGAGNSAGQAALFFSTHARASRCSAAPTGSRRACRATSSDQLATRSNIHTIFGCEVAAVHGNLSLEAIDIRDSATGETTRLESGGLYIFIGADAQTGMASAEIALDHNGYVLTGSDMHAAGQLDARAQSPTSSRRAFPASSRAATCGSLR